MQFTYVQATGEAFKNNIQQFKSFFSMFVGHFALLDPDPDADPGSPLNPDPIRIRIHITATSVCFKTHRKSALFGSLDPDRVDPQHCFLCKMGIRNSSSDPDKDHCITRCMGSFSCPGTSGAP